MGPQLRDADTPQRFEFTDFDLVVNIRAGGPDEANLVWEWSDDIDWEPGEAVVMVEGGRAWVLALAGPAAPSGQGVQPFRSVVRGPAVHTVPGARRGGALR